MEIKKILIMGASSGIGFSLVEESLKRFKSAKIFASYREDKSAHKLLEINNTNLIPLKVDPSEENQLINFKNNILEHTDRLDIVIICIGVLDSVKSMAEKKVDDITAENMLYSFKTNSISHALIVKTIKPLLRKDNPTLLAHLSAKVGSIEENQLGGWYSYRMSKASLNMLIKNLDIEFKRSNFNCKVVAIHPGTTETSLSKKYLNNVKYKVYSSTETANHILDLCLKIDNKESGNFLHWDGTKIKW